jgi:hypothetical protein
MERIGGVATVQLGFGERLDHLLELDDRAGPAVGQQEWDGGWIGRTLMDEMDVDAVDLGDELIEPVECRLADPPVVVVGPVRADLLHVRERNALGPVVDQLRIGPARVPQTRTQIVEHAVGHLDREGPDLLAHPRTVDMWVRPRVSRMRRSAETERGV